MKNYSGQMNKKVHSQLKAYASDNDMTIPEYIEFAVSSHLKAAGYLPQDIAPAAPQVQPAAAMPVQQKKNAPKPQPAAATTAEGAAFDFFDKNIKPMNDYYRDRVGAWLQDHGAELVLHVFKAALDGTKSKESTPLTFIDKVFKRIRDKGIKTVQEYEAAQQQHEKTAESGKEPKPKKESPILAALNATNEKQLEGSGTK